MITLRMCAPSELLMIWAMLLLAWPGIIGQERAAECAKLQAMNRSITSWRLSSIPKDIYRSTGMEAQLLRLPNLISLCYLLGRLKKALLQEKEVQSRQQERPDAGSRQSVGIC